MAAFALSELLPNKWRHLGIVFADLATLIAVVVGPVTARYGFYVSNWRWNFYSAAIAQALSFLGLYFYYHPPKHPNGIPYKQALREMDYGGKSIAARLQRSVADIVPCRDASFHSRRYSLSHGNRVVH